MASSLRFALSVSAVLATALLVVGCSASPGSPAPTSAPDDAPAPVEPSLDGDMDAAWLDDGRMFAIVTQGSSTCIPFVESISANGQSVTVELSEGDEETACAADLRPRATVGALPEGVDPTQDVEFIVTLGDMTDDVDLDGNAALTGVPGSETEFLPSAGWFDDGDLVLLTWGSSSCPPVVEDVQSSGRTGTVTFTSGDGMCTMDMAPRATIISFGELDDDADDDNDDDDNAFTLTLVGDNLDATISVIDG